MTASGRTRGVRCGTSLLREALRSAGQGEFETGGLYSNESVGNSQRVEANIQVQQ